MNCPHCGKEITQNDRLAEIPERAVKLFWRRVVKSDDCWIHPGNPGGTYARISVGGKQIVAHVVSWVLHNGSIPNGMKVCHKCDNPRCVRPDHLFLGTHADNMRDMVEKGRHYRFKSNTHPLSDLTAQDVLFIRESIASKKETMKSLSGKFGVTFQCIMRIVRGLSWKHIGGPRTTRYLKWRSAEEVNEIRRLAASGVTQKKIAEMFDMWPPEVSDVVLRKSHARVCS